MRKESVGARLAISSVLNRKVDELANSLEGILVLARLRSSCTQHVGDDLGVANFLLSHEVDQDAVIISQTSSFEFLYAEASKCILEQVKLNVLLV
jgi:hypothetical protein